MQVYTEFMHKIGDGRNMGKLENKQRFMQGKKQIAFYVNEAIFDDFNKKLKDDGFTKQKVLETAIYQYLNGIMVVNKD